VDSVLLKKVKNIEHNRVGKGKNIAQSPKQCHLTPSVTGGLTCLRACHLVFSHSALLGSRYEGIRSL
jgi:hypothetical protein